MATLFTLYMVLIPLVVLAALAEGLWLSRTRAERYDWKAWGTSLADLGVAHIDMPASPERVWRAIQAAADTARK